MERIVLISKDTCHILFHLRTLDLYNVLIHLYNFQRRKWFHRQEKVVSILLIQRQEVNGSSLAIR